MNGVINCIMIVALLIARFALDKFMDTTSVKVRFGIGICLLVIYTGVLEGFLYYAYQHIVTAGGSVQDCYQAMALVVVLINFAVLLVAVFYYFMRNRHKISAIDKMKLKDL